MRKFPVIIVAVVIVLPFLWRLPRRLVHFRPRLRSQTVVGVELMPSTLQLLEGASKQLTLVVAYNDGRRVERPEGVLWLSSNPATVEVDEQGTLRTVTRGSAKITAVFEGKVQTAAIDVLPPAPIALALVPGFPKLIVGDLLPLKVMMTSSDGKTSDATRMVSWSLTNPELASIDPSGKIKGDAAGLATVRATLETSAGPLTTAAVIEVSAAANRFRGAYAYRYDNMQTGQNRNEYQLNPQNVSVISFGKLFEIPVDGYVYAQPLYVPDVTVQTGRARNVLYVATEANSLYAFDADSGIELFRKSMGPALHESQLPCSAMGPRIGITGTPVIDAKALTLYLAARSFENGTNHFRLHALDITNGNERTGSPIEIVATVPGTGGGSKNGKITFDPSQQLQRPGLVLSNGQIYVSFGSLCDSGDFHGWLFTYDAKRLTRTNAFVTTPNGHHGGIWQAGESPAVDPDGSVYIISGDGEFDAFEGGRNFSDSFLKFPATSEKNLTPSDYFTPYDQDEMEINNMDLGSSGPLLLPDQLGAHPHLLFGSGKNGAFYLVDRDHMGHFTPANNQQIIQYLPHVVPEKVHTSPSFWQSEASQWLYVGSVQGTLRAFKVDQGRIRETPSSESRITFSYPGATTVVSSAGGKNGIVWALDNASGSLHAYDANDLGHELYNAEQAGRRDRAEPGVQFYTPLVANGKVYFGGRNRVYAYGLIR